MVKKYFYVCIAVLVLFGLTAGCTSSMPVYTDPAKTIDVNSGQQFTIMLDANATTGYNWEPSLDQNYIKLVSQEYKVNESKPGMVGVPGKQYFVFQAMKQGSSKIMLVYKRSFETTAGEQKVFSVNIK